MYRLTFEGNALYIFEVEDGKFTQPLVWVDVTGTAGAVNLRFDPNTKGEAFTEIIKHSLEVKLIRENEGQFTDIIQGDDQKWYAALIRNGELLATGLNEPNVVGDGVTTPRVLFYGTLTNETYGETLLPFAEVSLTFHDKIGELSDLDFEPTSNVFSLNKFFAEVLNTLPCSHTLLAEWHYIFQDYGQSGERLEQFSANFTEWIGKKKYEVLKQFLSDTKLQMCIDFEVVFGGDYVSPRKLFDCGAIRLKCVAKHTEPIGEYNVYRLTTTVINTSIVYDYAVQEGEGITTERTYSQFYFVWQPKTIITSQIVIGFTHKGVRYYSVVRGATALTQAQLEAIGCVFPCVVDQFEYSTLFGLILLPLSLNNLFVNNLGWTPFPLIGFPSIYRSNIPNVNEDIVILVIDPLIIYYYDVTDYVDNTTMVGYNFSEAKTRYVLGSEQNPIINRSGQYNLTRKAKWLDALLDFKVSDELFYPKEFNADQCEADISGILRYNYGIYSYDLKLSDIVKYIQGVPIINFTGGLGAVKPLAVNIGDDNVAIQVNNSLVPSSFPGIAFQPIKMIKSAANLLLSISGALDTYNENDFILYSIIAHTPTATYVYDKSISNWRATTALTYSMDTPINEANLTFSGEKEIPQPHLIAENQPYTLAVFVSARGSVGRGNYYVTGCSVKLTPQPTLPKKLKLRTKLNESMRKPVEFKSEFCTLPNVQGAMGFYRNGLMTSLGYPIHTLYYGGLEQTLLAHASDQYGYNYSKNRWVANIETIVEGVRLFNLYELDFRVMMLTSGTYDVRKNILKGSFIEVAQLDRLDAWLWDDDDNLVWEDGDRILL